MSRKFFLGVVVLLALALVAGVVLALQGAPTVYWVAITQSDGTGLTGYTTQYGPTAGGAEGAEAWTTVPHDAAPYAQDATHARVAHTDGEGPLDTPIEYGVIARETLPDGSLRLWLKR